MIFHRLLSSANTELQFKPYITSPNTGDVFFEYDMITASSYVDSGGSDSHRGTQWQLSGDINFNSIVADSGLDMINKTQIEMGDLGGEMLSDYYIRVRYYSLTDVSLWSEPVGFSTDLFETPISTWADDVFDALMLGFQ